MIVIYFIVYSVVFLCVLFGNFMVVIVVFKNWVMCMVINCFIVNLVVVDIFVVVFNFLIILFFNFYLGKF